LYSLKTSNVNV